MSFAGALAAGLLSLLAPHGARVRHDIPYVEGPRGRLDVYEPRHSAAHAPIAVFVYGGSWQSGDRGLYRFVGQVLAARGIITVIPDYRLYPQVRWPDFLRDNAAAVRFARDHAAEWGGDPARLYLIGHSAGAYNVAMLALDRRWLGAVGLDAASDIAGVVGLAGPYDFLPLRDAKLKAIFRPEATGRDTQPIDHLDGRGPPMLLLAGASDTVVEPGNSTRLAAAIQAHGGVAAARIYPGVGHVGLLTALLPPLRGRAPTLQTIVDFIAGR